MIWLTVVRRNLHLCKIAYKRAQRIGITYRVVLRDDYSISLIAV